MSRNPIDRIGELIVQGLCLALGIGGLVGVVWGLGIAILRSYDALVAWLG